MTGYGKESDLWQQLGYKRTVVNDHHHPEKWVQWQRLRVPGVPTAAVPPSEAPWAQRFFDVALRPPMLWLPLCPPLNASSSAAVDPPAGLVDGIPLGLLSPRRLAHGRLMVAPAWLASLGPDPESDWAGASPSPLAYVHITNMWKCFPHPCWSKAGRLYWLRAHGFWDKRLDKLGLTPRGAPFDDHSKVLALPPAVHAELSALARSTKRLPSFPRPHARNLGFRRLAALVHNLVTVAALLHRKPVLPAIPCELVRAVQSRDVPNQKRSRFGLCHASVIATGPSDAPVCHLAPGTWRPGGPDQCYHNAIMSDFDFGAFLQQPRVAAAANGSVRVVGGAPRMAPPHDQSKVVYARGALDLEPLKQLCREGSALATTPVVHLDGLLPLQEMLVDRPLPQVEFRFERLRLKSRQPRWPSLLQEAELHELASVCPGAHQLKAFRMQCVGYFIAE